MKQQTVGGQLSEGLSLTGALVIERRASMDKARKGGWGQL